MLAPKRAKHRKVFRGKRRGQSIRGSVLAFGDFGLKASEAGWVSSRQIEASRRALTHTIRRGGRVWIRIFPDKPITKKPPETRMGSGKGDVAEYVCVVRPGRVMFEMAGVDATLAAQAMRLAGIKLPIKSKFILREKQV